MKATPSPSGNTLSLLIATPQELLPWRFFYILFPDSSDKANILREQFQSVFTDEDLSSIPEIPGPTHPSISSLHISPPGVAKLLSHLKINKASGPDNIPSRLLKEFGEELAHCLANISQSSIDSGQLPKDWRRAKIAPAFKKGNTCQAENYRPISLTCICCKLLEHIVCRHLNDHLDQHHLLSRFQHGFHTRHSCETQLLTTVHDLMQMFDSRKQVDVAVLDFSKAFDTVPHRRLLKKLSHYDIDGPILLWPHSAVSHTHGVPHPHKSMPSPCSSVAYPHGTPPSINPITPIQPVSRAPMNQSHCPDPASVACPHESIPSPWSSQCRPPPPPMAHPHKSIPSPRSSHAPPWCIPINQSHRPDPACVARPHGTPP